MRCSFRNTVASNAKRLWARLTPLYSRLHSVAATSLRDVIPTRSRKHYHCYPLMCVRRTRSHPHSQAGLAGARQNSTLQPYIRPRPRPRPTLQGAEFPVIPRALGTTLIQCCPIGPATAISASVPITCEPFADITLQIASVFSPSFIIDAAPLDNHPCSVCVPLFDVRVRCTMLINALALYVMCKVFFMVWT